MKVRDPIANNNVVNSIESPLLLIVNNDIENTWLNFNNTVFRR